MRWLRLAPSLLGDALQGVREDLRSHALTLLAIIWGAAAVLLLLSLGSGFRAFLDVGLQKTGDGWSIVDDGYTTSETGGRRPGREIDLTLRDVELLAAGVPTARAVAGEIERWTLAETPHRTRSTLLAGAEPVLAGIQRHEIARGRWIDPADEAAFRRVVVLGAEVAELMFPGRDPIGRTLQADGIPFRVVGVLVRKGAQLVVMDDLHDRMIYVPLRTALRLFGEEDRVDHVYLDAVPGTSDLVWEEARAVLWPRHHLQNDESEAIEFFSLHDMSHPIRRVMVALHILLGFIGTVTLGMAGVGVANRMLALASARRRELAVRRACGARGSDVVFELALETLVVVLLGGAVGVCLGVMLVLSMRALPLPEIIPVPQLPVSAVATTFAVLVATGSLAGIAPARWAARVEPCQALRAS